MEMTKKESKFEVSLTNLQDGHSDWALYELDNTKTLLDHTTDLYTSKLTAVKFRADVKSNDHIKNDVATKLTLALASESRIHERWYEARKIAEQKRDTDNLPPARRVAVENDGDGEDEEENREDARGKKNLKLSNFDGLKPLPANKQFNQTETDHRMEHARVLVAAINVHYQGVELQRIVFESIISASFRGILVLKHAAKLSEDGNSTILETSKSFDESLAEASRAIGVGQDQFVRRSSFFGM
jgi:hypothetical protein